MKKGLRVLVMTAVVFYIGVFFSGCTLVEKRIEEYSEEKEECRLNPDNVTQFTYQEKQYTILQSAASEDETGSWVGYIRKLAAVDENGNILAQQDMEKLSFSSLTDIADTEPETAYLISFLNVYLNKDDSEKVVVDVNDERHEAVLTASITDKDTIYDYRTEGPEPEDSFTVNQENCTQLLMGGRIYQITDEIRELDKVGQYLDIIPKTIVFDEDTKQEISEEQLAQIDWYGDRQSRQRRAQWIFGQICEIKNTEISEAVAVEINYEYHIAAAE